MKKNIKPCRQIHIWNSNQLSSLNPITLLKKTPVGHHLYPRLSINSDFLKAENSITENPHRPKHSIQHEVRARNRIPSIPRQNFNRIVAFKPPGGTCPARSSREEEDPFTDTVPAVRNAKSRAANSPDISLKTVASAVRCKNCLITLFPGVSVRLFPCRCCWQVVKVTAVFLGWVFINWDPVNLLWLRSFHLGE